MHRQNIIAALLLIVLGVGIVAAGYAKGCGPLGVLSLGVSRISGGGRDTLSLNPSDSELGPALAPEISAGAWINSQPLKLKDLRGRVVVVEFWTFGCYNCRNTLPSVKSWDARYRDKGLTIIGVHTPELDSERDLENVQREVASLGITYPVVTDNNYEMWKAYGVEAWPTWFVLDKQGHVRGRHVGEGAYDETESLIKRLLAEDKRSDKLSYSENPR